MQQIRPSVQISIHVALILLMLSGCNFSSPKSGFLQALNSPPEFFRRQREEKLIRQFTESLAEGNERAFRRTVSTRFESLALRAPEAFQDLEILELPGERLEIIEVTSEGNARKAVAELENGRTRYQFIMVDDPAKGHWCIDDVELRQQKRGTRDTRSSVELMDLLLTIREYLGTMQQGSREELLAASAPELNEALADLPEPWFHQLVTSITSEMEPAVTRRHKIDIAGSEAMASIPSSKGVLRIQVQHHDEQWMISNLELQQRGEEQHPGSLLRQAHAMTCVSRFLAAYNSTDRIRLQALSEQKFFSNSLRIGNLSLIPLPDSAHAPDDFQIQAFAGQLTVMVPFEDNICRFDLIPADSGESDPLTAETRKPGSDDFVVSDVMVYDRVTRRQRNLRLAFTAPARAMLFVDALAEGNIPLLRQISSREMTEQIWLPLSELPQPQIPLLHPPRGPLQLQDSIAQGDTTELQFVAADGRLCSVLLEEQNGNLLVTDLQYPDAQAGLTSLEHQLLHAVPLMQFAAAWESGSVDQIRAATSAEFERLVWSNVDQLPAQLQHLPQLLRQPLKSIRPVEHEMLVEVGRRGVEAVIRLVPRRGVPVVDEITLFSSDGHAMNLRESLRQEIAAGFLQDAGRIRRAGFERESDESGVVHALDQQPPTPRRATLTTPSSASRMRTSPLENAIDMTRPQSPARMPDAAKAAGIGWSDVFGEPAEWQNSESTTEIHFRGAEQRPAPDAPRDELPEPAAETHARSLKNLSDHAVDIPLSVP